MKVLVAGGAGFVGSHLCRRLLADGHRVTCVDNLLTGSLANVADLVARTASSSSRPTSPRVPRLPADAVLHLASPASPVDYERLPLETMAANSQGTWRLLDLARRAGATFTYVSTSEAYGDPEVHPQPETYWGNVDPVGPRSCYDESKRFGEALVTSYRRVHHVPAAIVRVFNTYGPAMRRDDGRVMPEFLGAALAGRPMVVHGDGSQTRSFMYVDDLVEALVRVGLDRDADGQLLNIGNPEEVTILELAELIAGRDRAGCRHRAPSRPRRATPNGAGPTSPASPRATAGPPPSRSPRGCAAPPRGIARTPAGSPCPPPPEDPRSHHEHTRPRHRRRWLHRPPPRDVR